MFEPDTFPGATLHVDLSALQDNYRTLSAICHPAECAAAVKANAYGLGLEQCAQALWGAGCQTFFVALIGEAISLRAILQDATIYVLNGLTPQTAPVFASINARPILSSMEEIEEWSAFCTHSESQLPAAVHIETGINRLGLTANDVQKLSSRPQVFSAFKLALVMSHLANGDAPESAVNSAQLEKFQKLRALLPAAPASLANSAGVLNGKPYHFDVVRPGIALYGGNPCPNKKKNPMKTVARLEGTILQVRPVAKGEYVGYSGTWRAARASRIAIIGAGYADGFIRSASSTPEHRDTQVCIAGHLAPVVGRVSMDMITVDVTDIPEEIAQRGNCVELFGQQCTIDELAARAGTISYEIFTGIGPRVKRNYSGGQQEIGGSA